MQVNNEKSIASFLRSFTKVLFSNVFVLLLGIISAFIIPKMLGLEQYALYKTYGLYFSYIGVLTLGFLDGLYIKYGGKSTENISRETLRMEFYFLVFFQLLISLVFFFIGYWLDNILIMFFALSILPVNITAFYKLFYQAVGEFGEYAKINSALPVLQLALIILVFSLGITQANILILGTVLISYVIAILLLLRNKKTIMHKINIKAFDKKVLISNFKVGIFILGGNFFVILFYSIDRWFVKFLFNAETFALYSFAVSIIALTLVVVNSVSTIFYPLLVNRRHDHLLIREIKVGLLIFGPIASSFYFLLVPIVESFLNDYVPSLKIIAILIAGLPLIFVNNALYINLYKADKKERTYFKVVILMTGFSILLNFILLLLNKSSDVIAIATTITFFVWFLYSSIYFENHKNIIKDTSYLLLTLCSFLITSKFHPWWLGLTIYASLIILLIAIYYYIHVNALIKKGYKKLFR